MASSLREELLRQQTDKQQRREQARAEESFNYQFPFNDDQTPFLITPKRGLNGRTLTVDLPKELPLQFDLQAPQYAHRVLQDRHKPEALADAQARQRAELERLRLAKLQERDSFAQRQLEQRRESEIKLQLRQAAQAANLTLLEAQRRGDRQRQEEEARAERSQAGVCFGPNESPERVAQFRSKRAQDRSTVRELLQRQIRENQERREQEREQDLIYGQKLGQMAMTMQARDQALRAKKRQMHSEAMTRHWDEMRQTRQELTRIERIFK